MALQLDGSRQHLSTIDLPFVVRAGQPLLRGGEEATDAHRTAEPEPAPRWDRRAHAQLARATAGPERDVRGMRRLDRRPFAAVIAVDDDLGVQRQRHPQRVEPGPEVGRRCGHPHHDHAAAASWLEAMNRSSVAAARPSSIAASAASTPAVSEVQAPPTTRAAAALSTTMSR